MHDRLFRRLLLAAIAAWTWLAPTGTALAQVPQYGGTLSVCTIYCTLSPLSWDLADWNWKQADDTGQFYERLFSADLSKAKHRGGKYDFRDNNWIPSDAMRGELAESWRWAEPLKLDVKLRKGVMFPEKKGVMASRELVADDVVGTYQLLVASPKAIKTYWEHIDKVEALDRYTVRYTFNHFNAEWSMRSGYGHYGHVQPKEVVAAGAGNWKNHNGTGPFMLTDYVGGNSVSYARNPVYWDKESIDGHAHKLPFIDRLVVRTIKDTSAQLTALRTAKLDIMELVSWTAVDELRSSAPALKWSQWVEGSGSYLSLRMDTKPFDDIRVRRALNIAIDKAAIVKSYYGGHAELFAYPMHPDWTGYYEPLAAMPDGVRELFTYDPAKAKKLLAEAGLSNGFSFKVQVCSCNSDQIDLLQLISAYLEKIGVRIQIEQMEYAAFLSVMNTKTHAPGYMMSNAHGAPTITLSKLFRWDSNAWNTSMFKDPDFDRRLKEMYEERSEPKRQQMLKDMTREAVAKAPFIWLPTRHAYTAWWPWVKNYGGELRGGGGRPAPVYARVWIDQAMKKRMGYD
ncbi:MAG: ABC transporter substrate-binding protein [Betaproteobacteria bacterium]|nr:ABC transporter substrate-binding protein [Betaproteobacteria bacterium]